MEKDSQYSETIILQRIAEGDEQAFNELYYRHWQKVYTFLARMTKSHEIAEELTGDIFTKLWTGRELTREIQNMDGFLSRVAYNKAISFFRMAAREKKLQEVVARQLLCTHSEDTAGKLLEGELRETLTEAIEQLSPQRKLVFTLSREEGLTHEQIATRLNLSTGTVKRTMSNALSSIRKFLSSRGMDGLSILLLLILI